MYTVSSSAFECFCRYTKSDKQRYFNIYLITNMSIIVFTIKQQYDCFYYLCFSTFSDLFPPHTALSNWANPHPVNEKSVFGSVWKYLRKWDTYQHDKHLPSKDSTYWYTESVYLFRE